MPEPDPAPRFSGLERLVVRPDSNLLMVGERTNVAGSRRFARWHSPASRPPEEWSLTGLNLLISRLADTSWVPCECRATFT